MFANHPEAAYNMNETGTPLESCPLKVVTKNDEVVDIWNQLQSLGVEVLQGEHYFLLFTTFAQFCY